MPRIILVILLFLFLIGCQNNQDVKIDKYQLILTNIEKANCKDAINFLKLSFFVEELTEDSYYYRLIVDEPTDELKNIKLLLKYDSSDEVMYPSSGIFEEPLSLKPNYINKEANYVKGIILNGYIDTEKISKTNWYLWYQYQNDKNKIIDGCYFINQKEVKYVE